MIRGQWCTDKKRKPKMQTSSGFRLIRVFSDQHNADRFRVHVRRLCKQFELRRDHKKFRLKIRILCGRGNKKAPAWHSNQARGGGVTGINLADSIATP